MKVSVITICYNSELCISKTIESVLNQTYSDIEYIIIDGASSDRTVDVAESYRNALESKGYEYKIVSEKDNGIYDAMNKGIRLAEGELIGIINSGDYYEPQIIEISVSEYVKEQFDLFYADINLIKQNGKIIKKHSKLDEFPSSRHWNHPTMIVRSAFYNEIGLYKCEGIHDDFDFLLRARRNNASIRIVNEVLANFTTGGASNSKSFKKCKIRCRDRYHAYRTNGYGVLTIFECLGMEIAKFIMS